MWTKENRRRYDRSGLRYGSDLTDEEWAEIAPLIPPAKPGGNKRSVNLREVMNGLMYILSTGCQWRAIPKDLAPRSTVYDYFGRWQWDGTLERIHHALYIKCREQALREASPTAAIIDAQSVKSAEKGGAYIDPHGYDAGKKVKGKKRHVLVDTEGLVLHAIVTAADVQDRDGGAWLLATLFGLYPLFAEALCRRRLPGARVPQLRQSRAVTGTGGDREALRSGQGLRGAAQALGGGKNARLAQPMPPPGQGLGEPQSQGARISAHGVRPSHGQEAIPGLEMFPDRL